MWPFGVTAETYWSSVLECTEIKYSKNLIFNCIFMQEMVEAVKKSVVLLQLAKVRAEGNFVLSQMHFSKIIFDPKTLACFKVWIIYGIWVAFWKTGQPAIC